MDDETSTATGEVVLPPPPLPVPDEELAGRLRKAAWQTAFAPIWWVPGLVGAWVTPNWTLGRVTLVVMGAAILAVHAFACARLAFAVAGAKSGRLTARDRKVIASHRTAATSLARPLGYFMTALALLVVAGGLAKHYAGIEGEIEKLGTSILLLSLGLHALWMSDVNRTVQGGK